MCQVCMRVWSLTFNVCWVHAVLSMRPLNTYITYELNNMINNELINETTAPHTLLARDVYICFYEQFPKQQEPRRFWCIQPHWRRAKRFAGRSNMSHPQLACGLDSCGGVMETCLRFEQQNCVFMWNRTKSCEMTKSCHQCAPYARPRLGLARYAGCRLYIRILCACIYIYIYIYI